VAAAFVVAAGAAGTALANSAWAKAHVSPRGHGLFATSLVPHFAPHRRAWSRALGEVAHGRRAHHRQQPRHRHAQRQPEPRHHRLSTTLSIYERTAKPWVLRKQGCSAARRHESGVVVLDFGKPSFAHHGYGTLLFSGRFALNHRITMAMLGYARGYVGCLARGSTAFITLARGTSNYHPVVPSAYDAGVRWAWATDELARLLQRHGLAGHVESAAADDAEPAWDRHFRKTRLFFHGFRAAVHGHTLYDYGSLDGGVGAIWSARQAWFVAGGIRHTKALPEIYNSTMAREWAELARIARRQYHLAVRFAGVMTQGGPSCRCGLRPHAAHRVLARALAAVGEDARFLPRDGTNIVG
jgi:hypothetical protein